MLKYIQQAIGAIKQRVAGMKANEADWTTQKTKVADIEKMVTDLEAQGAKVDAAENALIKEREIARKLVDSCNAKLKNLDNLIYGIHGEETVKLADYGLGLRKPASLKPVPGKVVITSIRDDDDGEGFVVTWNSVDDASRYEIEKGVAPDTSTIVLAPPYPFLKSTTKTTLTDDDVVKGRRYFYRVRALNSSGAGEWSEPVYKVQ